MGEQTYFTLLSENAVRAAMRQGGGVEGIDRRTGRGMEACLLYTSRCV